MDEISLFPCLLTEARHISIGECKARTNLAVCKKASMMKVRIARLLIQAVRLDGFSE
nr:MAG TPA: hypothetical protein [Caudoviricetes sp.]